jgi:hypothetical protein
MEDDVVSAERSVYLFNRYDHATLAAETILKTFPNKTCLIVETKDVFNINPGEVVKMKYNEKGLFPA